MTYFHDVLYRVFFVLCRDHDISLRESLAEFHIPHVDLTFGKQSQDIVSLGRRAHIYKYVPEGGDGCCMPSEIYVRNGVFKDLIVCS